MLWKLAAAVRTSFFALFDAIVSWKCMRIYRHIGTCMVWFLYVWTHESSYWFDRRTCGDSEEIYFNWQSISKCMRNETDTVCHNSCMHMVSRRYDIVNECPVHLRKEGEKWCRFRLEMNEMKFSYASIATLYYNRNRWTIWYPLDESLNAPDKYTPCQDISHTPCTRKLGSGRNLIFRDFLTGILRRMWHLICARKHWAYTWYCPVNIAFPSLSPHLLHICCCFSFVLPWWLLRRCALSLSTFLQTFLQCEQVISIRWTLFLCSSLSATVAKNCGQQSHLCTSLPSGPAGN